MNNLSSLSLRLRHLAAAFSCSKVGKSGDSEVWVWRDSCRSWNQTTFASSPQVSAVTATSVAQWQTCVWCHGTCHQFWYKCFFVGHTYNIINLCRRYIFPLYNSCWLFKYIHITEYESQPDLNLFGVVFLCSITLKSQHCLNSCRPVIDWAEVTDQSWSIVQKTFDSWSERWPSSRNMAQKLSIIPITKLTELHQSIAPRSAWSRNGHKL